MKRKIGIIGFGNMGSAIGQRLKAAGYQIVVFDKDKNKTKSLEGLKVAKNITDAIKQTDVVILAIKPQDFDSVLGQIKGYVQDKLIVSIAAGITTGYMEKILGKVKIIRAMPNIGVKIAEAQTCLCKGRNAEDQDLYFVQQLFDEVGKTWVIKEEMIDAATAISGSGPAYIYYDMEIKKINPLNVSEKIKQGYIDRLKAAAEKVSFNSEIAMDLTVSTLGTSLHLARVMLPAELIKLITSKGGTTEAALQVLAKGGSWEEAALAAKKRAEELSKKE